MSMAEGSVMGVWGALRGLFGVKPKPASESNVDRFLKGEIEVLTVDDILPGTAAAVARFDQAVVARKEGRLAEAEALLLPSIEPPSIYTGHYRELFMVWRQLNRDDMKAGEHRQVVERVTRMAAEDDRMIKEMLRYWSHQQGKRLPKTYFDGSRNLKVTDVKALQKAAAAIGNKTAARLAGNLAEAFANRTNNVRGQGCVDER